MPRPQTITVPVCGKFGLILDQQPQELPIGAWSRAVNVRFKDGAMERFEGEEAIYTTPTVTPYYVDAYQTGTTKFFVHAGVGKVFADDGTTATEITPASDFTGAQDDRWTGGTLGGILILNNNKEAPHYWGGNTATNLAPLTGWPASTTAAVVRPFKSVLVALDITKAGIRYPHMIKTSVPAVPGAVPASWDHTNPALTATEIELAEESSLMVDCLPLGDANIIYKERSMYAMTAGGPFIFDYRRLPGNEGALARGCIASTPMGHVVLTAGDVIIHNGQGPRSIASGRVKKWLFNNIDSTHHRRSFVVANPLQNEVWVCIPTHGNTEPDTALVWNYQDDVWSTRELDRVTYGAVGQISLSPSTTWASQTETWDATGGTWSSNVFSPSSARLVTCSTAPRLSLVDSGNLFNGASFTSIAERTGFVADSPSVPKTLRNIFPRIDSATNNTVQIELGGAMDVEQAPTYPSSRTYTVGRTYQTDGFAHGRALAYRFTSIGNSPYRIKSFDLDIVAGGRF